MIKAEYYNNEKHYDALADYNKKNTIQYQIFNIIRLLVFTYTLVKATEYIFLMIKGESYYLKYAIIMLACAGFIIWSQIGLARQSRRNKNSFLENNKSVKVTVEFRDDELFYRNEGENSTSEGVYKYSGLYSAEEKGEFFFILLGKSYALLFDHSEITEGTPHELRTFLKEKLGNKFTANN